MTQKLSSSSVVVFSLWPALSPNPDTTRILSTGVWVESGALHSEGSRLVLVWRAASSTYWDTQFYKWNERIAPSKVHVNISKDFGGDLGSNHGIEFHQLVECEVGYGGDLGVWLSLTKARLPNQKWGSKIHEVSTWQGLIAFVSTTSSCSMIQNCCPHGIVMRLLLVISFGTIDFQQYGWTGEPRLLCWGQPRPQWSLCVYSLVPSPSYRARNGSEVLSWKPSVLGHCSSSLNLHLCNSSDPHSFEENFL